jgi:hypothetical protein
MKQSEIVVVGGEYMTKVGDGLVKVRVVQRREPIGSRDKRTTFLVRRVDNGTLLPKARTAAALRPVKGAS